MIFSNICYGLSSSGRSWSAAKHSVCYWSQLVCHTVGNVSPGESNITQPLRELLHLNFIMYRSIPKLPIHPPSWTNPPGIWLFGKNFGQIPCYVASWDGQMPHLLELQTESNPPPSRHVKATVETSSSKFSATTNFLFSLSSLQTVNKGIFHDITT